MNEVRKWSAFYHLSTPLVTLAAYLVCTSYELGNWYVYSTIFFVYGVTSVIDAVVPPTEGAMFGPLVEHQEKLFLTVALLAFPVTVFIVFATSYVFVNSQFTPLESLFWILSTGTLLTAYGQSAGHELMHHQSAAIKRVGWTLFSFTLYAGNNVSHLRSHHTLVGTPEDPATAKLGQNFYTFLLPAIRVNVIDCWQIEHHRLKLLGKRWWRNIMFVWTGIGVLAAMGVYLLCGWQGVGFYLAAALWGVVSLEMINYLQHYGLSRRKKPNGEYERVNASHSWNANAVFNNLMTLNVQRHAHHHIQSKLEYQKLQHREQSPQYPNGYSWMAVVAFVPVAWRFLVHPVLKAHHSRQTRGDLFR